MHTQAAETHKLGKLAAQGTWQGQVRALKPIRSVSIQAADGEDWHRTDDAEVWFPHVEKHFADKWGVGNVDERMRILEMSLTEVEDGEEALHFSTEKLLETWPRLKRRGIIREDEACVDALRLLAGLRPR